MTLIFKSENVLISSAGNIFTHGLGVTPAGTYGETRIMFRSGGTAVSSIIYLSQSDSVKVIIVAADSNTQRVDVVCQQYHSIIA